MTMITPLSTKQTAGCTADLAVLALPGGRLVKVEASATPSTFISAASAGQSTAAMAAVLGMVASQGLNSTPLVLLASHAEVRMLHSIQRMTVDCLEAPLECALCRLQGFVIWLSCVQSAW